MASDLHLVDHKFAKPFIGVVFITGLLLISLFLAGKLRFTPPNTLASGPCMTCDPHGKCFLSGTAGSCSWLSNQCSVDTDCNPASGSPSTTTLTGMPKCTFCNSFGKCQQNSTPCSGYNCTVGTACTPPPTQDYRNCPLKNGFPNCTQVNPLWSNIQFPNCPPELAGNNSMGLNGCGIAVSCSILCEYAGSGYCNVGDCMESNNLLNNYSSCGVTTTFIQNVLGSSEFAGDFQIENITPDGPNFTDPYSGAVVATITKEKIIELLEAGQQVQVTGYFTPVGGGPVAHHSLVVGVASDGKLLFNDPFFNCDNPNPLDKVCTDKLEDGLEDVVFTNATSVGTVN